MARAAAKLLPNNKERRHGRRSSSRDGSPNCEWSWGPGPTGEHAELGRAGATHPSLAGPALAPAAAGARPGAGKRRRRGPGRGGPRVTWAPRRSVPSLSGSGPRRPAPGGPSPAAAPARGPRGRAAGAPEPPRRGGPHSRAAGSRHALPPRGRPRSQARRGKGLQRTAGGRKHGLRHPSRSVTAAATTTRAVLLLPTCRKDTEHARAETTSGLVMLPSEFLQDKLLDHSKSFLKSCGRNHTHTLRFTLCPFLPRSVSSQPGLNLFNQKAPEAVI
ncbi:translation initiation factor IF-2-like [Cricetulus griseus]|uniref:Translation initiation factor IF-2-like n=1 Tax=Cricetulus griseus TaxID=10029 RepID=A0A9J7JD17_CRIGR|nr:translation initiation factor IF-2-like [Cricetulus griseus]